MGVRGLTSYIAENSKTYLLPHELCDTYLVVDGNSIAFQLYRSSKSDSAFGGDYDEYYKTVTDFFSNLIRCNVKPIVLLDGGYEKKKFKKLLSRSIARLPTLRVFAKGFSTANFFPLFMRQTFMDVMADMNIFFTHCDFEADVEIATVAKALNCPVLSYDSDFYIFDVLYIPFSTVYEKPVHCPGTKRWYMKCSIFNVTHFLKQFSGLDKTHLPIIATLLGNDYTESALFQNFFNHISMYKCKRKSYNQRKIYALLHWLEDESFESAINQIVSLVGNKNAVKVMHAIRSNIRDYSCNSVSGTILDRLTSQLRDVKLERNAFRVNLPIEFKAQNSQCEVYRLVVNMLYLKVYFTPLQVENVYYQSSHFPALQLIRNIYTLLIPYMENPGVLKLYLTVKNNYGAIKIDKDPNSFLNNVYLDDILKEPKKERLKWLCRIVGIDDAHLNVVSTNNWSIFLMSYIYWVKELKDSISTAHVHALILMVIANEIVQKYVGYFRSYSKFVKGKKYLMTKINRDTEIKVREPNNFNEMVERVPLFEKLYIHGIILPYRQTTEKGSGKAYDISVMHLFACFQSVLFHVMQLNALLNYPLPFFNISNFYSGTLLFNFYLIVKVRQNYGETLFKDTPSLAEIYRYLCESLCKFLNKASPQASKSRKKKKRNQKTNSEINTQEIIFYEEDSDFDYSDESNPFAILKNI